MLDESSQKFAFQNMKAQRLTFDYLKKNYGGRGGGGGSMLLTKFTSVTLSIIVIYSMFYSTLGVRIDKCFFLNLEITRSLKLQ